MEDQGAARTRSGDGREREHDARAVHRNLRASCNTAAACVVNLACVALQLLAPPGKIC